MIIKLLFFILFIKHDFHSSITIIEHNKQSMQLEITAKYFEDDLIKFLKSKNPEYQYKEHYDPYIDSVFSSHFVIELKQKKVKLSFLGSKKINDIITLFLESEKIEDAGKLKIKNTVLLKIFEDQVNITQIKSGNYRRTQTISNDEKTVEFIWPLNKRE